jgi:hypothetical protein
MTSLLILSLSNDMPSYSVLVQWQEFAFSFLANENAFLSLFRPMKSLLFLGVLLCGLFISAAYAGSAGKIHSVQYNSLFSCF